VRAGARARYAGTGSAGLRTSVAGPMGRRCPKCDAAPGWRCGRYVGSLWTALKTFHAERRVQLRRYKDATGTVACRALRAAVLDAMAAEEFGETFDGMN
jgi:hypothetical protein